MMHSLIYFPGFEPESEEWLKFALLYLDSVRPIVPKSADVQLTDAFRDVARFTDLIDLHRPTYEEGFNATADAIDQVERILRHPDAFEHVFGVPDVGAQWRKRGLHTTELWSEKFSDSWKSFCRENNLGRESDHGIVIPESLADVYMTILANCIADGRGMSPVSDDKNITGLSFFVRRADHASANDEVSVLETSLPIVLPENLSEIDITAICHNILHFSARELAILVAGRAHGRVAAEQVFEERVGARLILALHCRFGRIPPVVPGRHL